MIGSIAAAALALTLVAAPASADPYAPVPACGTLDRLSAAAGETVTYSAPTGTFTPREPVGAEIAGADGTDFAVLPLTASTKTKNAEADGSASFAVRLPASAKERAVIRVAAPGSGVQCGYFTVSVLTNSADIPVGDGGPTTGDGGAGAGTSAAGLARTGSQIAVASIAGTALLLLAAGVTLMVVRARRRRHDAEPDSAA